LDLTEQAIAALARLVVQQGLNLQPGQPLLIHAPIEAQALVRYVVQSAYEAGGGPAQCVFEDPELLRIAVDTMDPEQVRNAPSGSLPEPAAITAGCAHLRIAGPRPSLLQGVSAEQLLDFHQLFSAQERPVVTGQVCCALPFATRDWATWIRPELEPGAAQAALWHDILHLCGIGLDAAPGEQGVRLQRQQRMARWLNTLPITRLHLGGEDADLSVDLLPGNGWLGSTQVSAQGIEYFPELPATGLHCLLQGAGTQGALRVRQPVTLGASSVRDLQLEFRDGTVSNVSASQGRELLESLLEADDNAARLGQLGLVERIPEMVLPAEGFLAPIMNRACGVHVTLGYPEHLESRPGANCSSIGIDLVLADQAMEIDAVCDNGAVLPLLRGGRFCL